jgi:BlaI family transcriptional regulator, penicillinase repressor
MRPTESELEILHVLWENGTATVREVNDRLNQKRETGYTTTLKLMQIMFEKGLVRRDDSSRTHTYSPAVPREITQSQLLQNFVDNTFQGKAADLVMQALGNHQPDAGELNEIKALIAQIEQQQKQNKP